MSSAKTTFDRSFQISIIKLLFQDFSFLTFGTSVLESSFFEDKILIRFFQIMKQYLADYGTKITATALWQEFLKDYHAGRIKDEGIVQAKDIFDEIAVPLTDAEYVRDETVRFCKRQAVRAAMLSCASLTDSEDAEVWDTIYSKIGQAVRVGDNVSDQGIHYFKDYASRIALRNQGDDRLVIPTGIKEIDSFLKGGPKAGQIAFWMAASGVGKSLALAHCGKRAVIGGYKVLHYTLELSELETADRYDACWAKVPFQDLVGNSAKISNELGTLHSKYGDSLIIKEYPTRGATVNTIEAHMINLINSGWVPNLVIVDYLDLLRPTTAYNDLYADLGAITGELRGLGAKYNCVMWTATQVNRSGYNMEIVDMEQAGDSLQKMMIADIVVAICMNREERAANRARLFIAKNRNGPAKIERPIVTAYDRMCFYDLAATEQAALEAAEAKPVTRREETKKPTMRPANAPSLPKPTVGKTSSPTNRRQPLKKVDFPMDNTPPEDIDK